MTNKYKSILGGLALALIACGCSTVSRIGQVEPRQGDEIVAAGQFFHTGTHVVLWMDPKGYDAYRVERRFSPIDKSDWKSSAEENKNLDSPNRYGLRKSGLSDEEIERVRGGGWDLPLLQRVVDQFVIHFDDAGTSQNCFKTLQDSRGLSVQFMLDLDGTIYQTLDLKERAWQATISNSRSVGVEIANMGAHSVHGENPLHNWYQTTNGETIITIPKQYGDGGILTPNFIGHPARPEPIIGVIQGEKLMQYDYTPQQYAALTKLTAALCRIFPNLKCQYPVDADGKLIPHKLTKEQWDNYHGVLGHYHIQTDKVDPGPAFNWDLVIGGAQKILAAQAPATPLYAPRQAGLLEK